MQSLTFKIQTLDLKRQQNVSIFIKILISLNIVAQQSRKLLPGGGPQGIGGLIFIDLLVKKKRFPLSKTKPKILSVIYFGLFIRPTSD